jgi:mannose-6-phosphate isomerase-like protein (cupin superfamily)
MSSNFRFIDRNVDISKILKQLQDNPEDWRAVSTYENTGGDKSPYGFLPLTMAVVEKPEDDPKITERQKNTPLFTKYFEMIRWLRDQEIKVTSRAAFFKLKPGDEVGRHIDIGSYYLTRDRFHLSISGRYLYECDGEEHIIEPGTFFWFDNKKYHSAVNIGTVDRLTFVFDVPHSHHHPNNSKNFK